VSNTDDVIALVQSNNHSSRLFSVGIGDSVSHYLVEGIARAGKGTAQFVTGFADMSLKVMKQLKEAIQPALVNVKVDWGVGSGLAGSEIYQAPYEVPPIFDSQHLLIYSVFGKNPLPSRIKITADSSNGPLAFDLPVDRAKKTSGKLIHTLASREMIRDLEEGRSWMTKKGYDAKSSQVKAEIVKLGLRYQLASLYTSYLAVERRSGEEYIPLVTKTIPPPPPSPSLPSPSSPPPPLPSPAPVPAAPPLISPEALQQLTLKFQNLQDECQVMKHQISRREEEDSRRSSRFLDEQERLRMQENAIYQQRERLEIERRKLEERNMQREEEMKAMVDKMTSMENKMKMTEEMDSRRVEMSQMDYATSSSSSSRSNMMMQREMESARKLEMEKQALLDHVRQMESALEETKRELHASLASISARESEFEMRLRKSSQMLAQKDEQLHQLSRELEKREQMNRREIGGLEERLMIENKKLREVARKREETESQLQALLQNQNIYLRHLDEWKGKGQLWSQREAELREHILMVRRSKEEIMKELLETQKILQSREKDLENIQSEVHRFRDAIARWMSYCNSYFVVCGVTFFILSIALKQAC
jgi:hypothetical protein